MARHYSKVSVPAPLMEVLTRIVRDRPELGYRSASDAVTECLRQRVYELARPSPSVRLRESARPPSCPSCGRPPPL